MDLKLLMLIALFAPVLMLTTGVLYAGKIREGTLLGQRATDRQEN